MLYCFSAARMVARTRLNVTLCVHCLSCDMQVTENPIDMCSHTLRVQGRSSSRSTRLDIKVLRYRLLIHRLLIHRFPIQSHNNEYLRCFVSFRSAYMNDIRLWSSACGPLLQFNLVFLPPERISQALHFSVIWMKHSEKFVLIGLSLERFGIFRIIMIYLLFKEQSI
jgi:hypothetical protein